MKIDLRGIGALAWIAAYNFLICLIDRPEEIAINSISTPFFFKTFAI